MQRLVEHSAHNSCNSQLVQLLRTHFPGLLLITNCCLKLIFAFIIRPNNIIMQVNYIIVLFNTLINLLTYKLTCNYLLVSVDAVLLHCGNTVDNIADICLREIHRRWCSSRLVFQQVRTAFDSAIVSS